MDIRSRLQLVWLLLTRMTFRHWRSKLGHYLLLLGIVAVGVGAFNGIRQASRAASANFGLFNQAVSGQSDFLIESPVQRLREQDLDRLGELSTDPDWHLIPVIEGSVTAVDEDTEARKQLRLIGLDLLALGNLPTLAQESLKFSDKDDANWYDWIGSENEVWVGQKLADALTISVR